MGHTIPEPSWSVATDGLEPWSLSTSVGHYHLVITWHDLIFSMLYYLCLNLKKVKSTLQIEGCLSLLNQLTHRISLPHPLISPSHFIWAKCCCHVFVQLRHWCDWRRGVWVATGNYNAIASGPCLRVFHIEEVIEATSEIHRSWPCPPMTGWCKNTSMTQTST